MPSGATLALRGRPAIIPPKPPPTPPPPKLPDFFIGVCQQADSYGWPLNGTITIDNFRRWKDRGVNLLVDVPSGDSWTVDRLKQWRDNANAAGLYQARPPIDDSDLTNPLMLAASIPDEVDRTGDQGPVKSPADAKTLLQSYLAKGYKTSANFDGSRITGLQGSGDSPRWTAADYADVLSLTTYPSCDVYPVSGWGNSVPLDYPAMAYDQLCVLSKEKPGFIYLETGDQHAPWLGTASRGPTPDEFEIQMEYALNRKRSGMLKGLVYFPLQPFGGFSWDTTKPEIERLMFRFAPLLMAA